MKRKCFLMAVAWLFLGLPAWTAAFAAITGSQHDFKGLSWNKTGEICVVCHTPHNAGSTAAPLWNHAMSAATYTVYSSPSLNAKVEQPSSSSKACLSCHDGTVAVDSFGGNTGTKLMPGSWNLGADLSNDHPISFTFNTALATADGGLNDPATKTVSALNGKTIKDGLLIGDKVECASCHDVHNNKGYAPSSDALLIVNNAGSALCLTCHNK